MHRGGVLQGRYQIRPEISQLGTAGPGSEQLRGQAIRKLILVLKMSQGSLHYQIPGTAGTLWQCSRWPSAWLRLCQSSPCEDTCVGQRLGAQRKLFQLPRKHIPWEGDIIFRKHWCPWGAKKHRWRWATYQSTKLEQTFLCKICHWRSQGRKLVRTHESEFRKWFSMSKHGFWIEGEETVIRPHVGCCRIDRIWQTSRWCPWVNLVDERDKKDEQETHDRSPGEKPQKSTLNW